ncbi:hypothetical protein IAT38_004287 [Cryptococcus sp. DSM 104549]
MSSPPPGPNPPGDAPNNTPDDTTPNDSAPPNDNPPPPPRTPPSHHRHQPARPSPLRTSVSSRDLRRSNGDSSSPETSPESPTPPSDSFFSSSKRLLSRMFGDAKRDGSPSDPSLADNDQPPTSTTLTLNHRSPPSAADQAQDEDPFADGDASPGRGVPALTRVQRRRSSNDVNQYTEEDEATDTNTTGARRWRSPARLPPAPLIRRTLAASPGIRNRAMAAAGRENEVRGEAETGGRYVYGGEEEGRRMPGGSGRRVDAGSTTNDGGFTCFTFGRRGASDAPQPGTSPRQAEDAPTTDHREDEKDSEDRYDEKYEDEGNWGVRQWREARDATQEELTHSILRVIALEEEIRALRRRLGEGSGSGEEDKERGETAESARDDRHTARVYESALTYSSQVVNAMVGSITFQEVALALLDLCGRSADNPDDRFGERIDRLAAAVNSPPIGSDIRDSTTLREVLLRALQIILHHYSPLACSPDQPENFEDMVPPDLLWLFVHTVDPALQRELKAVIKVFLQACLPSNRWVALYMLLGQLRTLGQCPDTGLTHAEWARQQVWAFKRRGMKHTERPIRVTDLRRATWEEVRDVPFHGSGMRWLKEEEIIALRKAREEQWEAVDWEEEGEPQ